jgi:hypothetical protein
MSTARTNTEIVSKKLFSIDIWSICKRLSPMPGAGNFDLLDIYEKISSGGSSS